MSPESRVYIVNGEGLEHRLFWGSRGQYVRSPFSIMSIAAAVVWQWTGIAVQEILIHLPWGFGGKTLCTEIEESFAEVFCRSDNKPEMGADVKMQGTPSTVRHHRNRSMSQQFQAARHELWPDLTQ